MRLCNDIYYPRRFPVGEDRYGGPSRCLPAWQVCVSTQTQLVSAPVPHEEPVSTIDYGDYHVENYKDPTYNTLYIKDDLVPSFDQGMWEIRVCVPYS